MKGYFKYLIDSFKNGKYILPLMIISTIIIYNILYGIAVIQKNFIFCILSIISLILGTTICISWNNYQYNKNK